MWNRVFLADDLKQEFKTTNIKINNLLLRIKTNDEHQTNEET